MPLSFDAAGAALAGALLLAGCAHPQPAPPAVPAAATLPDQGAPGPVALPAPSPGTAVIIQPRAY